MISLINIQNDSVQGASKEQLSAIQQINNAVNLLDQQTQKNASIATQTYEVAVETDTIAKLVVNSADEKEFIGKESVQIKKLDNVTTQPTQNVVSSSKSEKTVTPKIETKTSLKTITSEKNDDEWESF